MDEAPVAFNRSVGILTTSTTCSPGTWTSEKPTAEAVAGRAWSWLVASMVIRRVPKVRSGKVMTWPGGGPRTGAQGNGDRMAPVEGQGDPGDPAVVEPDWGWTRVTWSVVGGDAR